MAGYSPILELGDGPLTPREKVAAAMIDTGINIGSSTWPDEIKADALALADAILTTLASGSGDHAELARLAGAARRVRRDSLGALDGLDASRKWDAFAHAATPATVLALIAEVAALGAEAVGLREHRITADLLVSSLKADLAEAERKLAEAEARLDRWEPKPFCPPSVSSSISKEAERG